MKKIYYRNLFILFSLFSSFYLYGWNGEEIIPKKENKINDASLIIKDMIVDGECGHSTTFSTLPNPKDPRFYSWEIVNGDLPDGIEFDKNTNDFWGTPMRGGVYKITVRVKTDDGYSNEATMTFNIKKTSQIVDIPHIEVRGRVGEEINLRKTNANLDVDLVYTSTNTDIVKVINDHSINLVGLGTTKLVVTAPETDYYAENKSTIDVLVVDPNDPKHSYQGFGKFELVKDLNQLDNDQYYVVVSDTKAMSYKVNGGKLEAEDIVLQNDEIINPSKNIVWKLSGLESDFTLYNEVIERNLSFGNYSPVEFILAKPVYTDLFYWKLLKNNKDELTLHDFQSKPVVYNESEKYFEINESASLDNINVQLYKLVSDTSQTTIWDGTTWSNGMPTDKLEAIVKGDLIIDSPLVASKLVLESGSIIVNSFIQANEVVNKLTSDKFIIKGAGVFELNSSLKTEGEFTVVQNSSLMILNDATLWSSPVNSQNLRNFSLDTLLKRFYKYDESKNSFVSLFENDPLYPNSSIENLSTYNFEIGKGYHIRVSAKQSTTLPSVFEGKFIGQLNNDLVSVPVTKLNQGYNLIGNPYPSTINADLFLDNNPKINALYFWTHESPLTTSGYANNNYASYTKAGGVSASAGGVLPNSTISKAQGFFVETTEDALIQFNNSIRTIDTNPIVMHKGNMSKKMWVDLYEGTDAKNQILVAYLSNATNKFDNQIDAEINKLYNGSSIYTLIKDSKKSFVIQGRDLSTIEMDTIQIGFESKSKGIFTIKLADVENLANQSIFLRDKKDNQIIDLSKTDYKFNSEIGVFNDRFEIVYSNNNLGIESVNASQDTKVVKTLNGLRILSKTELKNIEIFDLSGKKIVSKEVAGNDILINSLIKNNQILVIKITDIKGGISNSKIIY